MKTPASTPASTSKKPVQSAPTVEASLSPIETGVWRAETLLKLPEVIRRTTMCKTKIYTLAGFPKPIKVGGQSSAWIESEVDAWIAQTIAAGRQPRAA
jgi:prophage regulatory protein